ncbi:hypothetical protein COCC4DRAFT_65921 [Bipolaris maydis ATCC 48331]|uniref:Uncharacterized protein n=2 Tax=Cochliobolus heterostrophus TaxID=5016 RepID=M2TUU8_COCH5|nr:uncharacterized protein COCC4DRAFT_65921 [Bipolaris maydis ATCC 48331]EMD85526.1 hypothetical protein COCHEDRAFT_1118465 [Bipolaris maydis C5]ENI00020.1 hypothetical protein COCC4DRAFT_65921 [Bipolaris maydis ATCC 48331]
MSSSILLIHTHTIAIAYLVFTFSHNETLVLGARQLRAACYSSCVVMCALTH